MVLSSDIILETDRCKLRQIKKEDIPFIFSATRYKGFNDGLLWDAPESEDELVEGYDERVIKTWNKGQSYAFTICLKEENKQLGSISIRKDFDRVWTTGFWLHPQSQGSWFYGLFWYLMLQISVLTVIKTPLYLQRPVSMLIIVTALLINGYFISSPTGFEWLIPVLFLKIVYGHTVKEEPYRPETEKNI